MKPNTIFTILAVAVATLARAEDTSSDKAILGAGLTGTGASLTYFTTQKGQLAKDIKAVQAWKVDSVAVQDAAAALREKKIRAMEVRILETQGNFAKAGAPSSEISKAALREQAAHNVDHVSQKVKAVNLDLVTQMETEWKKQLQETQKLPRLSDELAEKLDGMSGQRRALYFLNTPEGKKYPQMAESIAKGQYWSRKKVADQTRTFEKLHSNLSGTPMKFPKLAGLRIAGFLAGTASLGGAVVTLNDLLEIQKKYNFDPKKLEAPVTLGDVDYDAVAVEEAQRAHERGEYDQNLE